MKRKLTKVEKLLLITIALAASFYFYLEKIYDPKLTAYEQAQTEIANIEQEILAFGEVPGLARVTDAINEAKDRVDSLEGAFVLAYDSNKAQTEENISSLLNEVTIYAASNGLKVLKQEFIEVIEIDASEDPDRQTTIADSFQWQVYMLVFQGNHQNLIRFVRDIKEMKWSVLIEHIEIKSIEDSNEFEIVMRFYI